MARCEADIKRRIEIARNLAIKDLFTAKKVKIELRINLINRDVWSVLLYGAEFINLFNEFSSSIFEGIIKY